MAASFPPPAGPCGVPGCRLCAVQGSVYFTGSAVTQVTWTASSTAGYASGGLVSLPPAQAYRGAPRAAPSPGMEGFSSRELGDFEPAAGVVTGVRWWGLPAPDLTLNPLDAEAHWPRRWLRGAQAEWQPGLNEAACLQGFPHPVPAEPCGCGYYAFWREQPFPLYGSLPVLGVIEGSGRVLSGELGFRAQRARIVALHLVSLGSAQPVMQVRSLGSGLYMEEVMPEPLFSPAWTDAWRAVISDRLEQLYPGAKVYENRDTMLTVHPPDLPPPPPEPARAQCPWCTARMTASELAAHAHRCPLRLP